MSAERMLRRIAQTRPDRLVLHREASPLSRGELERRLLASAGATVYDFDDALHCDWGAGGLLRRVAPKAPKALVAVRHADRVVAGNPTLADWASQHSKDVVVIPSCVDPDAYRQKTSYQLSDPPRLGWIGSADNDSYLRLIGPALREVHHRTGARLTVIGTMRKTLGELEDLIDRIPWSTATQHRAIADLDVGVFPVPDSSYTRGKSGYKLLQYGAAALPAIASPVGVNRTLLQELHMPGPETVSDWVDSIEDLLGQSVASRERVGRTGLDVVRHRYSFDAWQARWEAAVGAAPSEPGKHHRDEALG